MNRVVHNRDSFYHLEKGDKVTVSSVPYTVDSIARGGMGCVYFLWKDTDSQAAFSSFNLGLKLALKAILPEYKDERGLALFRRELTVWAGFKHFNIVRLLQIVDGGDAGWVAAMDWCPSSLQNIIDEEGKLSIDEGAKIILDLINALDYAYKKDRVHHLDLKPDNILCHLDISKAHEPSVKDWHSYRFMIADWGIASIKQQSLNEIAGMPASNEEANRTLNNIGTLMYMGPERFKIGCSSTISSDVFSLGMIYLQLITGRLPFRDGMHPKVSLLEGTYFDDAKILMQREAIPESVARSVLDMIAVMPDSRPSSYNALKKSVLRANRKAKGVFSRAFKGK